MVFVWPPFAIGGLSGGVPVSYASTTVKDIYGTCLDHWQNYGDDLQKACAWIESTCLDHWREYGPAIQSACAWIEAENVQAVWLGVVKPWFDRMQDGTAAACYPHVPWSMPNRPAISQEMADLVVAEMDADFALESARFKKGSDGIARGPEFSRLPPHARLAMLQDLMRVTKSEREILVEATKRIDAGERFGPDGPRQLTGTEIKAAWIQAAAVQPQSATEDAGEPITWE